jgi:hypothetical protein
VLKAMRELEADLALPLATHPRYHNTTLRSIPGVPCGVSNDTNQLLQKIFPSGEQWICMASHYPVHVSERRGDT